jgi:predicted dithiol-disulfide oxidoreductase (DUF899 family)
VVEDLRAHGLTLAEIARTPSEKITPTVRESIARLTKA